VAIGDWWRHGVIYQIYPRSFMDSNGDGIGDLPGITARLDHLRGGPDSLGVDAIWLSPFYRSPMADYGYDVSDYRDVDPMFGTLADFDALVAGAHERGIRVIVDFVPNHTSDQHPWFTSSRSGREDPKRDWYVWADPAPDGGPPNNWRSSFRRVGPAWTFDERTGQYYLHSFLPEQPDLNWWNPQVREAMDDVLRFWLDRGVDGFRIDVAHKMAKDPELADNPLIEAADAEDLSATDRARLLSEDGRPLRDQDLPEVHEILRRFRRTLDEYDDRMLVGEVYLLHQPALVPYLGSGDELHLAHNFVFLHQPWKASAFREVVEEFEALVPEGGWPDWFFGNHDHSRVASRYDDGSGNGRARARVAAMMLLTLRGTPFLYQGEELGMTDVPVPPERRTDVDERDPERTPMQWDATPNAGFSSGSSGAPWLPVGPDYRTVNAEAERGDATSMLALYRSLLQVRRGSRALREGSYATLTDVPDGVFAYLRATDDEQVLVALNMTGEPVAFDATPDPAGGRLQASTDPDRGSGQVELHPLRLGPDEGVVVSLD
jgi:alpha-glucosidase